MAREAQSQSQPPGARWAMPRVYPGQAVLWRAEPTREAEVAIVTCVGGGNISVSVLPRGSRVMVTKDGIRHIADPNLRNVVHHDGVWDYTDFDKRILSVIE